MKPKLNIDVRDRTIKAYVDLIMVKLLATHPMSGYQINKIIAKDFHVLIGPSTIYSKLYTLERSGFVRCYNERWGKVFELTSQGRQLATELPSFAQEIWRVTKAILSVNKKARSPNLVFFVNSYQDSCSQERVSYQIKPERSRQV